MQPEPPKPITRLAEPIDREGARPDNRIGRRALAMATWGLVGPCLLGFVLWVVHPPAAARLFPVAGGAMAVSGVASTVLGLVALVRAANRHLNRSAAIWAIVLSLIAVAAGLWAASTYRPSSGGPPTRPVRPPIASSAGPLSGTAGGDAMPDRAAGAGRGARGGREHHGGRGSAGLFT